MCVKLAMSYGRTENFLPHLVSPERTIRICLFNATYSTTSYHAIDKIMSRDTHLIEISQ